MDIISLKCPSCGASITTQTKQCEYCQSDILVKSFKNLAAMPTPQVNKYMASYRSAAAEHPDSKDLNTSVGLCFLRLKKYDQATDFFVKAQADNFDDATPFFYAAVARLQGKKPFMHNRQEIDKMMEDIHLLCPCRLLALDGQVQVERLSDAILVGQIDNLVIGTDVQVLADFGIDIA